MALLSFKVASELDIVVGGVLVVSAESVTMFVLRCVVDVVVVAAVVVVVIAVIFTIGGHVGKAVESLGLVPKVEVV